MNHKPIQVTQPSLPPLEEYIQLLSNIWETGILTHNGPMVQKFEASLSEKLNIRNFVSVTNGTIAIQMALKALQLKGEIITTPFTWIATISAIQWEGCKPVFCDIDPSTLNIDPKKIEAKITDKTVAILPVHVFGVPCDIETITSIAKKHGLKVIYDAAHALGSTHEGKSILEYGDISATSLHATKLLNTGEGGGCVTNNQELDRKLRRIRFFGFGDDRSDIVEEGFNGKMTEIHAALGIVNLKYFDSVLNDRKTKYKQYIEGFLGVEGLSFQSCLTGMPNYSYFPVIFETEKLLLKTLSELNSVNIYPRRYFYPAVNTYQAILNYDPAPIAEDISNRILCMPLYFNLAPSQIDYIIKKIKDVCRLHHIN